jgi:hypothetical protein
MLRLRKLLQLLACWLPIANERDMKLAWQDNRLFRDFKVHDRSIANPND